MELATGNKTIPKISFMTVDPEEHKTQILNCLLRAAKVLMSRDALKIKDDPHYVEVNFYLPLILIKR
mgnify:CR=1 FL=1